MSSTSSAERGRSWWAASAIGAKSTGPGELRGTSIQGGVCKTLAAGDIVNIPAKTPHQTLVKAGQKITYFVVKVKAR